MASFGASTWEGGGTPVHRTATFPARAPEVAAFSALGASAILVVLGVADVVDAQRLQTLLATIGYLLTPYGVVVALVWARTSGTARQQKDPWFDVLGLRSQLRRLQIATLLAFFLAYPHVTTIARWVTTTGLTR